MITWTLKVIIYMLTTMECLWVHVWFSSLFLNIIFHTKCIQAGIRTHKSMNGEQTDVKFCRDFFHGPIFLFTFFLHDVRLLHILNNNHFHPRILFCFLCRVLYSQYVKKLTKGIDCYARSNVHTTKIFSIMFYVIL